MSGSKAGKKSQKRAKRREQVKNRKLAREYEGVLIRGVPESRLIRFNDRGAAGQERANIPVPVLKKGFSRPKVVDKVLNHPLIRPFAYVVSCVWDECLLFLRVLKNEGYLLLDWLSKGSERRGREYDVISEPFQFAESDKKVIRGLKRFCRLFFGVATPLFVLFLLNVKLWILIEMSWWMGALTVIAIVLFVLAAYKLLVLNEFYDDLRG